jgi:hypothetical protein
MEEHERQEQEALAALKKQLYARTTPAERLQFALDQRLPDRLDPLVHLYLDLRAHGSPSAEWQEAWVDPARPDSLAFAWESTRLSGRMFSLLKALDPVGYAAVKALEEHHDKNAPIVWEGNAVYCPYSRQVRQLVPTPPSLSAVIAWLGACCRHESECRRAGASCPIAEFLRLLEYHPDKLPAWAARWNPRGEPLRAAWEEATSPWAMGQLILYAVSPAAGTELEATVNKELGDEEFVAPARRVRAVQRAIPVPPTMASVLRRRERIVQAMQDDAPG